MHEDYNWDKIDLWLRMQLEDVTDPKARNIPCFVKVIMPLTDEQRACLNAMGVNNIVGEINTGHLSAEQIKELSHQPFVHHLAGSHKLRHC